MSDKSDVGPTDAEIPVGERWPELGMAGILVLLAILVLVDSLRVGIGWAEDGPRSGYFPFYIGLLLLATSGTILISTALRTRKSSQAFATRSQLASVIAVLVPMVVYVAAIYVMGIYFASILLIGYFMRRHGKFGWVALTVVSISVPLVFFLVFERWFLVPLPKGPIEQMLGF